MDEHIETKNREEWRRWLNQNHDKRDHIWLTFYKKSSNKQGLSLAEAVEEAISFGWIDGKLRQIDDQKHVLRFSPRKPKSVWSKINKDRAMKLIENGRMTLSGLVTIEAAKKSGAWDRAYTSRVAETAPCELEEALVKNDLAKTNFARFSNSYKNTCVSWVNAARTEKTRMQRIRDIVERSSQNQKLW